MTEVQDGGEDNGNLCSTDYHADLYRSPSYDLFLCPLTQQVMRDPMTLENGQTFEREAIEKWFRECRESGKKPICPVTSEELSSTHLIPAIALRKIIEEWNQRNDAACLTTACSKLSADSSETEVLNALKYIQSICERGGSCKHDIHNTEAIPMIIRMLKSSTASIRCKALETLRMVVEDDDSNKEAVAVGGAIRTIVKFLPYELTREREEAVLLLHELSRSVSLAEKIGEVNGAILILVGIASSKSEDILTVQRAQKTLENLERCEKNILPMAENGRLQPLLRLLLEGSPETQLTMAFSLGELVLSNDVKVLVAQTAGSSLIKIMKSGNIQAREAALKALSQISSYEASARILIENGILPPLVKGLFTGGPNQLPLRLKEISATILANVVACGANFESIFLDRDRQTLVSEDVVHNLLQLISNTGPAIECQLLQVLVGLTSSKSTVENIVAAIRSLGATISIIQFIEAPQWEIRLASIKLLHNLSPYMAKELAEELCGSPGLLGNLVRVISENTGIGISEEQAYAVGLLAELPETHLVLTQRLLGEGAFPIIISSVLRIRHGETRGNRFVTPYLEGLVRVLSRVTYVLWDESATLALACDYNLTELFADLLQTNGLENVQIISAMALENLSRQSIRLTKVPDIPHPGICGVIFPCLNSPPVITGLCKVHRGICSTKESFCLVEAKAVEKLVACLDHTNDKLVEAALAAICTLLEDGLDIEQGVSLLGDGDGIGPIFDVLIQSRTQLLRQRAVWAVERILRADDIAYEIAGNRNIGTELVEAFRHGDYRTRQIAEKALKRVDKLPNYSGIIQKVG